ncbi:DUF2059 domain-containing protein [Dokdonia sinensis]|uniref:DUF2059 domain-containing protein n=1 Tax=Dokdonia sinensis TaxID=2479847 RepID=A0A3M0FYN7_9FLAO|nr:DUF2059 domain-containing protein [Dokdonia sinensis]RMB57575.1 DUF2059 domain-containing protein [Dokdonia sinensis]
MKKILCILFAFTITLSASAQESSYREDVLDLLSLNGTTEQYRNAIDQLFELLKRQYASNDVTPATWDELRDASSGEIGRIKAMLVSAYRGTYTQDDIKNMISFYQTEAGQQLLKDQTALTDAQRNDVSFFYNTDTGKKILTSKDKISRSVGEVSEIWSRDLYKMMVDKLAEKGHVMQQ